ncbi:sensor histidine kinase [Chitinophaga sp. Cy-1792]|uniref:sensor histidine kinase n=1 Tax=Chitinophaga sp. Cy-1792 TaxID=2608339 RepID=UPI001420B5F5|nr:histidine kinase [Chitinophaga sp. Cy-1792]NIG55724.1 sensor histidine kinase [Chitinophaga sp. Cy-1792]
MRKQGLSTYWKCQLFGWGAASLYWAFKGLTGEGFMLSLAVCFFITDMLCYIGITHIYRAIARHAGWNQLGAQQLLWRLIPAVIIMGVVFMVVTIAKLYLLKYWLVPSFHPPFREYAAMAAEPTFIAGVRLMAIWLLAYHLYHYSQREIRIATEKAKLELITSEMQLQQLTGQLQPHFLFNSLNLVKSMVRNEPEQARRAIDLLASLLRSSLYEKDMALIPFSEEMEIVGDYLELQQLRWGEILRITHHLAADTEEIKIPRWSIQTLVENAVKHGIMQQQDGGVIRIHAARQEPFLMVTVTNTGAWKPATGTGIGLQNLRDRLALHYHGDAALEIHTDELNVSATIKIPLHAKI